jgi:aminopeptidase
MTDPRIQKMAKVLVNYSLELKPGEQFYLQTSPLAEELSLEIYKEAILSGAHVLTRNILPGGQEIFYKYANDAQIDYISPVMRYVYENFDATLSIDALYNTRELSSVDPAKQQRAAQASAGLFKTMLARMSKGELKWCYTVYPTNASAQDADMSLQDYQEFVYGACLLDSPDPVKAWKDEGERQRKLIQWLSDKDQAVIKGENVDLRLSIKGRNFLEACGKENFPDGEIYTSPIEKSVNGWVRFGYPAIFGGREVNDIELWFEEGKVVKEKAAKGEDLLTALLNTDPGARYLGEWGIGTNYGIQRFTKNMLFDEKIGGTIHLAVGSGFPEVGSQNESGLHWDMLCNMAESEITLDGELFYSNGKVNPAILA